jgi:hypothetical protein
MSSNSNRISQLEIDVKHDPEEILSLIEQTDDKQREIIGNDLNKRLSNQESDEIEDNKLDFVQTKLEIVEENHINNEEKNACLNGNEETENPRNEKHLVTFSLPTFPNRNNFGKNSSSNSSSTTNSNYNNNNNNNNNSNTNTNNANFINVIRKPAFNPLHVILKDKNKYYTTEYI